MLWQAWCPLKHVSVVLGVQCWRRWRVLMLVLVGRMGHAMEFMCASRGQVMSVIVWLRWLHAVITHVVAEVGKRGSPMQNMATVAHEGNRWRSPGHRAALGRGR
jgi:hypothetical protein